MEFIKKHGILLLLASMSIGFVVYEVVKVKQPKVAYVDNLRLFGDFNFKKEKQAEYDRYTKAFQGKLDTLRLGHKSIEDALLQNPNNKELEKRLAYSYEYYQRADYEFGVRLDSLDKGFNNEVWLKLNAYIEEFGKKQGYDMILGASGNGTIMYGNETFDITDDVLEYANWRYEGNE